MKTVRTGAALVFALLASACASGGGGSSSPPSPPPPASPPPPSSPPPPPNASLLSLTTSQDFTPVAATGNVSFPTNGGAQSGNGGPSTALMHYDAGTNTYSFITGGRGQTFGPSDLDAADSSSFATAYLKKNGSITDSLTLTKPGTAGRFTYQYVGSAFWQRTQTSSTIISGSLDAMVYGYPTANSSLPRTGSAEYSVDLLGVESTVGNVAGISGSGLAQVDFARGVVVTHGTAAFGIAGQGVFSSEARLSSTSNAFAGTFQFDDLGPFTGQINGQFFGPNAEEFGAAFSAANGSTRAAVGALIGRGGPVTPSNASLTSLTGNQFFSAEGAILTATLPGGSGGTNINGPGPGATNASASALIVNYDAASQAYTLISPSQSHYFLVNPAPGQSLIFTTPGTSGAFPLPRFTNVNYVATKEWLIESGTQYSAQHFVYGMVTPDSALPRTGSADFAIGMTGTAVDGDFLNAVNLNGFGTLSVNFGSGAITTQGSIAYSEDFSLANRPRGTATGAFSGSAQLSSTTNSFTGPISLTGIGAYSGVMSGHFFGPVGQEVGGSFSASDGQGGSAAGTFAGGFDPLPASSIQPLASLSSLTSLGFVESHYAPNGAYTNQLSTITYDPASSSYTLTLTDPGLSGAAVYTVGLNGSTRNAAASDASYDVFLTTIAPGGPGHPPEFYTISVLKALPSNPTLALTYTSLAELIDATPVNPLQPSDRHFVAFGVATPSGRMPIEGTATYNGIAVGTGSIQTNAFAGGSTPSVTTFYNLTGATSMSLDFAAKSFTSTLSLTGSDIASSATQTFSTLNFSGDISGSQFTTHQNGMTYAGKFFGPNAEEIGGTFDVSQSGSGPTASLTHLQGAFVGKH